MSWMRTFTIFAAAVAVIAMAGGTAGAQQRVTASQRVDTVPSTTTVTANGMYVPSPNPSRGYTGISFGGTRTLGQDGHYRWADYPTIRKVAVGSPAEMAGLAVGDSILSVNGADARIGKILYVKKVGDTFLIRIRRGDGLHEYTIVSVANPGVK